MMMKCKTTMALLLAVALPCSVALAGDVIGDDEIGISASVFDTPTPAMPAVLGLEPGENALVGGYFDEAPPLIPHLIEEYLPIVLVDNQCLDCHDAPDEIGAKRAADDPVPMPKSHYTDLRNNPGVMTDHVIGARYNCMQCHAIQKDAQPLVESTYQQ
jgi:cytochrome c-type protein NapB